MLHTYIGVFFENLCLLGRKIGDGFVCIGEYTVLLCTKCREYVRRKK